MSKRAAQHLADVEYQQSRIIHLCKSLNLDETEIFDWARKHFQIIGIQSSAPFTLAQAMEETVERIVSGSPLGEPGVSWKVWFANIRLKEGR